MTPNELFTDCNDKYFDGILDDVYEIRWTERLGSALGRTNLEVNEEGCKIRVHLNGLLRGDPVKLRNVMAHELIHVWQIQMYLRFGDESYLDINSVDPSMNGHGPYFQDISSELNFNFPELKIVVSDDVLITDYVPNGQFKYLDVTFNKGGEDRRVIFNAPGKSNLNFRDLKIGLEGIYGKEDLIAIQLCETFDPVVTCFGSLTNRNKFFKRQPPIYFKEDDLLLLRGISPQTISEFAYPKFQKTELSHNELLQRFGKFGHLSFIKYLEIVVAGDARLEQYKAVKPDDSFAKMLFDGDCDYLKEIHKSWLSIECASITKLKSFHDFIDDVPLDTSTAKLSGQLIAVVKEFGWRRADKPSFFILLKDCLGEHLSETSIAELLNDLSGKISSPRFFDGERLARGLISLDMPNYIIGNILEKMSDGYVLRTGFFDELSEEWKRPIPQAIARSVLMEKSVRQFSEGVLPAYLSNSPIEMSRKLDIIVASWAGLISRGVAPSAMRTLFVGSVTASNESSHALRQSRSWPQDKAYSELLTSLPELVDSSLSHCFGVGSKDFRLRKNIDRNQMGLFG